jgi:hypothetical protein
VGVVPSVQVQALAPGGFSMKKTCRRLMTVANIEAAADAVRALPEDAVLRAVSSQDSSLDISVLVASTALAAALVSARKVGKPITKGVK